MAMQYNTTRDIQFNKEDEYAKGYAGLISDAPSTLPMSVHPRLKTISKQMMLVEQLGVWELHYIKNGEHISHTFTNETLNAMQQKQFNDIQINMIKKLHCQMIDDKYYDKKHKLGTMEELIDELLESL